jgi:serine/threonine-protein kinase
MRERKHQRKQSQVDSSLALKPSSISGVYRLQSSPRNGVMVGGRYEIIGLLDRGGTSEVYLAKDAASPTPVIVKWLTQAAARDPQHCDRFVAGARATMTIDHPAVARVYSVEVPNDAPPYLVMEALQGESLADYLARQERMPLSLALSLAHMAASGLVAAHAAGIIHRDIKPGNLFLLGPRGQPRSIKIIDFGLSKDLRNYSSGPVSSNLVLGTAQYMAPEQVLADPVDARTDIYAFGAVLFRMLTGQLPFDLDAGADLFSHQLFSPAPPPSWLLEEVDPRLEQLILKCLRKHPENRYASMEALLVDLNAIMAEPEYSSNDLVEPALKRQPDVYKPRNPKGQSVAADLAQYFGAEAPPPPTTRLIAPSDEAFEDLEIEEVFPFNKRG